MFPRIAEIRSDAIAEVRNHPLVPFRERDSAFEKFFTFVNYVFQLGKLIAQRTQHHDGAEIEHCYDPVWLRATIRIAPERMTKTAPLFACLSEEANSNPALSLRIRPNGAWGSPHSRPCNRLATTPASIGIIDGWCGITREAVITRGLPSFSNGRYIGRIAMVNMRQDFIVPTCRDHHPAVLQRPRRNLQHPLNRQPRALEDVFRQFDARGEVFHAVAHFFKRVQLHVFALAATAVVAWAAASRRTSARR